MDQVVHCIFPDVYPKDLLDRILEDNATQQTFENVYRISQSGECNRDAFICTALVNSLADLDNRDAYLAEKQQEYTIDDWSTSCWNDYQRAYELRELQERYHDGPQILVGNILPETGYSILTTERPSIQSLPSKKRNRRRHHVDWWIFEGQDVSVWFKVMEV